MKSLHFSHISVVAAAVFLVGCLNAAKVYPAVRSENVTIKIPASSAMAMYRAKVNGKSVIQTLVDFFNQNPELFTATIEWYNQLKNSDKDGVDALAVTPVPVELASKFPAAIAEILLTPDGCLDHNIIATFEAVIDLINEGVSAAKKNGCKCSKSCWKSCCCSFWTKKVPAILMLSVDPAIKIFKLILDVCSKKSANPELYINPDALTVDLVITY